MVVSRHDREKKTMSATIQPRTLHASANALKLVVSFVVHAAVRNPGSRRRIRARLGTRAPIRV